MKIGIPKEIMKEEYRVAASPAIVTQFVSVGHEVLIETGAGLGVRATDEEYKQAGATIVDNAEELWSKAEMIYKVKQPLKNEYKYFREGLIIFCYLHIAAEEQLLDAMLKSKVIGIAYETIEVNNRLPLLKPMSEIAGCMSIVEGANFLKRSNGGKGIMLQGIPGVPPAHVVIIGSGIAGRGAIRTAVGVGARVTVIGRNLRQMAKLQDIYGPRLETLYSNPLNIAQAVSDADLLVGAVLVKGSKAPKIVTEKMVKSMDKGSVIVDIAVDQGSCVETIDRLTTHTDPVYEKHGILHYAVANMPGIVARTATKALGNATSAYCLKIASKGWLEAVKASPSIKKGVNVAYGKITYKGVADSFGREYTPLDELI